MLNKQITQYKSVLHVLVAEKIISIDILITVSIKRPKPKSVQTDIQTF